jgi:O-antigen/teichoic acid export membrane protein
MIETLGVSDSLRQMSRGLWRELAVGLGAGDEREKTRRDAMLAFAVRVLGAGLVYLSQIALARWMGSFEYGIFVLVWTLVLVLGGLSSLGLSLTTVRLVPEYRESGEEMLWRGLVRGTRLIALATSSAVSALGLGVIWLLHGAVDSTYAWPLSIALLCVPLYALMDIQDGIGRGHGWIDVALVPPYILRPLMLLSAMAAIHALGYPLLAASAAGAAVIATWAAAIVQARLINGRLRRAIAPGPRRYDVRRWLLSSLPLITIAGSELVLQNTDVLVISRYMTPEHVAVYFAAAKTMSLTMFVHYAVGSAVAHRFSGLSAAGDRESLNACVRDAVKWTFWPSLAGAAVILALGKPLLGLFGPQFDAGYPLMLILAVGLLFRAAMGPVDLLLNMAGEQARCAGVLIAATVLNISLNFALVPMLGLAGAAAATSLSMTAAALLNALVAKKRLGIDMAIWRHGGGQCAPRALYGAS